MTDFGNSEGVREAGSPNSSSACCHIESGGANPGTILESFHLGIGCQYCVTFSFTTPYVGEKEREF